MACALNASPGAFAAAVLDVPFLDVLGAMCDPSLPLTVKERPEWGDPLASQAGRVGRDGRVCREGGAGRARARAGERASLQGAGGVSALGWGCTYGLGLSEVGG